MRLSRKTVAITAAGIMSVTGTGVAFAAWTAHGNGSGTAKASSAQAIVVTASTPATGDLYPGGPAGRIDFKLSNPNPYPVTITGVTYGSTGDAKVTVSGSATSSVSFSLPANAVDVDEHIDGVLLLDHSADDSYQGKTINVPLTLSGSQN